jgi:signal transduction histidine kinase
VKIRSLRFKIAVSAGALAAAVVIAFAAVSAWWFYHQQMDIFTNDNVKRASARHVAEAREETYELIVAYLLALPVAAAIFSVGAWWQAGHLTKPLVQLATTARSINARSLDARLPEPAGTDEIFSLARTLNLLLDRLERSFLQSSRFAADASHELRTPLAIMRAELEAAIKADPTSPQAAVFVGLLEENQRLAAISDKLLLLARADAGRLVSDFRTIDLSALVEEVADDFGIIAGSAGVAIDGVVGPQILVAGDGALLRQLLLNLFDNALKHNEPNGWIRYRLEGETDCARFSIANSGPPIPSAVQSRLFERFYRGEGGRDADRRSAGLGLSLCHEIAAAHRGRIALSASTAEETAFVVEMPRAFPERDQDPQRALQSDGGEDQLERDRGGVGHAHGGV